MKNRLLLKLFTVAVIVGMAFTTSCKDYDDDINSLRKSLEAQKTELQQAIDGVQSCLLYTSRCV